MELDVVAYLAAKGHRGQPVSGGREVTYSCFFDCDEPPNSKKRKLYVATSTGLYQCKVCGAEGGPFTLQKHFGDEPRSGTSDDLFMRQRILDAATDVGVSALNSNDDPLLYLLNDRGLSVETIIERKLGFISGGWSLIDSIAGDFTKEHFKSTGLVHRDGPRAGADFFFRHLLIPITRHGHTIQIRGRAWGESRGGKYMTGPGEPARMFNADSLDGADEVIITEGEFDAMILHQVLRGSSEERLRRMAVIGLPGTQAIPEEFDDFLSSCKRVFVGFDSDEAGKKATVSLAERIGPRARVLTLPYENARKCDWTEYLLPATATVSTWATDHPYAGHDWRDVHRLLSQAAGKRIFSIAEAGEAYRAFREIHDGLSTGFVALDQTIKPGLLPGQVVIALAKTGAGKTVWLCNLAYNMRHQKVLFITLEMTREEIYERMRRIYLFHQKHASDSDIEAGLANVFVCDQNRLKERDIALLVSEFAVEADGPPDVVFIDYLGYFARGASGNSPYEKVSSAVMALKEEAKAGRFVIISPAQVNRGAKEGKPIDLDDARDAGAIEETADFLLALYRPDDALSADGLINNQQPTGKVKMTLLKSRHGGKNREFSLQMDLLTLAVVDADTRDATRAEQHNHLAWRGYDWDDLRRKETALVQQLLDGTTP